MINYVEHPFIYLLAICVSSSEKCLFRSFAHFKNWVVWILYTFWMLTLFQIYGLQIFFTQPIGYCFILLTVSFTVSSFLVWCSQVCFCFCWLSFWCGIQKIIAKGQCPGTFLLCFLLVLLFLVLHLGLLSILSWLLCRSKIRVWFHCFACGNAVSQHHLIKTVLSLLCLLGVFVKN